MKRIFFVWVILLTLFSCKMQNVKSAESFDESMVRPVISPNKFTQVKDLQNQLHALATNETPSVVFIGTEKMVTQNNFDPYEFFFNDPRNKKNNGKERKFKQEGLGSGVIYKKKGNIYYIVTNNHVVAEADKIKVTVDQQKFYDGEVISTDPDVDVAVVKIKTTDTLQLAKFGDSDKLETGDFVIAIGNPFGLFGSMTFGIISALGRSDLMSGKSSLTNFIQTDAAINPGNSGGPLLNIDGEVIGINTLIYSRSGGSIGIGFAIPVNIVRKVADQIIDKGKVTHGYLGIYFQELDKEKIDTLGLKGINYGMLVNKIFEHSPAEKSGIKTGDVLIELNGKPLKKSSNLTIVIGNSAPGTKVNLVLLRDGKKMNIEVTLGNRQDMKEAMNTEIKSQAVIEKYGMELASVTKEAKEKYSIPSGVNGVVITNVVQGRIASQAGLEEGDVIYKINKKLIKNIDDVKNILKKKETGNYFFVNRKGREFIIMM